jgi:putative ABC transport system substrate-binding protein
MAAATAARPLAVLAQQGERSRKIGVLMATSESDPISLPRARAFEYALSELGWRSRGNVRIEYRWAAGETTHMSVAAKELVELQPDVLLATGTRAVTALARETRTIPIVFVMVSDPIASGFVASLARPGGTMTGVMNSESSLGGKWLQLLKDIAPSLSRVAVLFNPDTIPHADYYVRPFEEAARGLAVTPIRSLVRSEAEIEHAICALGGAPAGGLIVLPEAFTTVHRRSIISAAARCHVPAIYPFRFMAADGGLMSYGLDLIDLYGRAARYVDRILRGAGPAELPVQQPTRFEFAINVRTAASLGLHVPLTLIARADEVIE